MTVVKLSQNICFPTDRTRAGFSSLAEKSGVPAYYPLLAARLASLVPWLNARLDKVVMVIVASPHVGWVYVAMFLLLSIERKHF